MSKVIKSISHHVLQRLGLVNYPLSIEIISIFLLWLFTISSLIGIGLGFTDWFIAKTPINLMLGFLLVLINIPFTKKYSKLIFVVFFLFGMGLEIAGVIRGDIFGVYHYGENLGFKVFGVPLMIGIYWAVLTTVTSQIGRSLFKNTIVIALFGASLMVGLDFLMEQMAHTFDYWHFKNDIAPLQNYVTWFGAAFLLNILAIYLIPKGGKRFALHLYFNQIVFFAITFAILKLW